MFISLWAVFARRCVGRGGRLSLCSLLCLLGAGCATTPGSGVSTGTRLQAAAWRAASDPITWGSAAGAALMRVDNFDQRLSRWAIVHTPVYGSNEHALNVSDNARHLANYGALATALAAPLVRQCEILVCEATNILNYSLSHSLTLNTTGLLKREVGRQRPQSMETDSFPSAHSSTAFNWAAVGREYLPALNLSPTAENVAGGTFTGLAVATAWARVEGGVHYPSDVLVGAAVGNFFGIFLYDLIAGPSQNVIAGLAPQEGGGYTLQVGMAY